MRDSPHTIEVDIGRIRERFKDNPDFEIVTMRGIGYKGKKAVKREAFDKEKVYGRLIWMLVFLFMFVVCRDIYDGYIQPVSYTHLTMNC